MPIITNIPSRYRDALFSPAGSERSRDACAAVKMLAESFILCLLMSFNHIQEIRYAFCG